MRHVAHVNNNYSVGMVLSGLGFLSRLGKGNTGGALRSDTISQMNAEERTFAALNAIDSLTAAMKPELVAWWNQTATIGAEYAKFQKRRTALAKRTASVKSALRAEERKFGAAVVKLLRTDGEVRAVLLPKLLAAAKPEDKATLEQLLRSGE
jgi:hypothetical protein